MVKNSKRKWGGTKTKANQGPGKTEINKDAAPSQKSLEQSNLNNNGDRTTLDEKYIRTTEECMNGNGADNTPISTQISATKPTNVHDNSVQTNSEIKFEILEKSSLNPEAVPFVPRFQEVEHTSDASYNILVLGQSGVGKSTWINSLITYIKYDNMKLAQQNELIKQIPIQFTITDDNYDVKIISSGTDANENHDIGTSCTIDCRMYSLNYKNCKINVIDTPGIGDTAGIERDRINIEKILHFISFLNDVHAICVLLKPNESRIDTLFKFCLSSILGQLNKQAVSNLLFCFTNARSTLYKPGETMVILYTILEQMKLNFTMDFSRIYCVDNEAYRYLCTVNVDGINYSQQDVSDYDTSYNKSVHETKRMLDFILTLTPHKVNDTTILNNIRKTITYLLQPIVNAACDIEEHIASPSKNSREIIKTLTEPTESKLCCYSKYCLKHIRSNETGRVDRKPEICVRRCVIKGAKYGYSEEDKIRHSVHITGRGNCKKCDCNWKDHKLVATENKTIKEEIKEPGNTNFTDYKKCLITTSVKLTLFMKKHSVVYVDLIQDYLQDLIDTEMQKSALTSNQTVIKTYKKILYEYESELKKLKSIDDELTAENVLKWKEDIFSLPEFGETIRSNFENTERAYTAAIQLMNEPEVVNV